MNREERIRNIEKRISEVRFELLVKGAELAEVKKTLTQTTFDKYDD